jgi:YHS domain-containing protein
MLQNRSSQKHVFDKTAAEIDDVMIKDPFCNVYFPKRDGVRLNLDGKDLYFCSAECRDKFMAAHSKK